MENNEAKFNNEIEEKQKCDLEKTETLASFGVSPAEW